jgi:hypothetical protein
VLLLRIKKKTNKTTKEAKASARARLLEFCGWDSDITSAHGSPTRSNNSDVLVNVNLWKKNAV